MIGGREIRLDIVGERIHAGRSRDVRREVERQLGVCKHRLGEQPGREDDLLDVRLVIRDHARAADLRAGSRGRRQRDEVRQIVLDRPHLWVIPGVFEHVARMDRHQRDRLGDVERSAAAQPDDRIGAMLAERRNAVLNLGFHRIAPDFRINADLEPVQIGDELLEHRQRRDAAVGHDERALEAVRAEMLGHERARARPEVDGRRKGETVDGHRAVDPTCWPLPICTKRSSRMSFGHCATLMSGRMTQVSVRR